MTTLRWTAVVAGALLLAAGAVAWWLLGSESGARWAAGVAHDALGGRFSVRRVSGALAGPLTLDGLHYRDPEAGIDLRAERVVVHVLLWRLPAWRVHVRHAAATDVLLRLSEPTKPRPQEERPFTLEPPIDVVVERFTLERARIERSGAPAPLLVVDRAETAGRWTDEGVVLRTFALDSPQGHVRLAGRVAGAGNAYDGEIEGEARWRLGEHTWAGRLSATARDREVRAGAELAAPLAARLDAKLVQDERLPWRFTLRVPRFDPRRRLAPESELESLSLELEGQGDRARAEVRGETEIGPERIRIEPLRVALADEVVHIETLTLRDARRGGTLTASGDVRLDREPFHAELLVRWQDLELPARWAGQTLATRGEMSVAGSTAKFSARGDLTLGPPGQPADIAFVVDGSPEVIAIERLTVVQKAGRFAANGSVRLEPELEWRVLAQARSFDPGALFAGWNGRLAFELASEGRLTSDGPRAALRLRDLQGRLRDRPVSGRADLTLRPGRVVAGSLRLRSGASVLSLTGAGGETLDATAVLQVASLGDWVPEARGRLDGRFRATGTWPAIALKGAARARGAGIGENEVRILDLRVDAKNPLDPAGTLRIAARGLAAAGFDFDTLELRGHGTAQDHTLELDAAGEPLGARVRVRGSRLEQGWSGTIERLALRTAGVPPLALREPARITLVGQALELTESCLQGDGVSLCIAGSRDESGGLHARYVIDDLPIGLIRAMAAPHLSYELEGTIQGRGEVRRTADGALFGQASLSSAEGGVAEPGDEIEALLRYEDVQLVAELSGDAARVTATGIVGGDGQVQGELTITGLQQPAPALQGNARVVIPQLAPVELLVPQLASVKGRAEASAAVQGTTEAPQITAEVRVAGLAAEAPLLGVRLVDGSLEATRNPDGSLAVSGGIASGGGRLSLRGGAAAEAPLRVAVTGERFLVADIPGARVVVSPQLELVREPARMTLTGTVDIPEAAIDLARLPQGGPQRASPDVVVVDAEEPEQAARGTPLHADIVVVLGENVKLAGYGLEAELDGRLSVRERPGERTVGSGEIQVAGTYKAYGQDLTIERGRLLFAGTPLDNPQLDILAARQLPDVTARLHVTGTARQPRLEVSAEPAMSPTQALSYLVRGKPIEELGQGEGDIVQTAARSLGGAAGNLLAKSLGRRFGVDEIGIEENEVLGGSAFTVGEYLSPRLFLSYGIGLFEPGEVITLRYEISNRLSISAAQGPEDQRASLELRIER